MAESDAPVSTRHAVQACLANWRARGADQADPVRFRLIEALARRAAALEGEARRLLDARLATLAADYEARLARPAPSEPPATPPAPGPLAALVAQFGPQEELQAPPATAATPVPLARRPGPPELRALRQFRRTWTRLHADQRLSQSQARVPDQAGPLNSYHLVHRSLKLMRDLAPDYLHRFVSYVDTLLWLDQAHGGAFNTGPGRADGARKGPRGRQG